METLAFLAEKTNFQAFFDKKYNVNKTNRCLYKTNLIRHPRTRYSPVPQVPAGLPELTGLPLQPVPESPA